MVLLNFDVRNVSMVNVAEGGVTVSLEYEQQEYHGLRLHTDIIEAGVRTRLQAFNRYLT